jgi:hypothetical protein
MLSMGPFSEPTEISREALQCDKFRSENCSRIRSLSRKTVKVDTLLSHEVRLTVSSFMGLSGASVLFSIPNLVATHLSQ